ncbi:lytic polysaccharide monooxygenase [Dothidotthia symphoricarpi CBS 119687]|uniref:AA9 family lytic polysaccharide monooxygenase n=1 Tax=Dothidotthia symphoricarpi CBS 119687 TaxID=1392245 RepID=A0A6A6AGD6_9PLEO|nr:lytic polysaccharide monooxygenase [Dothidotthia symphoricarpi CBS 119687]KAF2129491.1 lytic polysaccharide monooxygenase [Dothidotthia symphoricarpi CBS 119687]
MKTQSILFATLASAPAVFAHTAFTDFFVDGMPQGDAVAMRMSMNSETTTNPIAGLHSDDMACNVGGTKGVSRVQTVEDGALLSFEIRAWPNDATKERMDSGHKGPCAFYLKKVSSAIDDTAAGDGWFKVFDHGYDASTKQWCTDDIINNNGLLNVRLPEGLQSGYYLARPEILALHQADKGDPQFYTGCAQIFLKGTGNLVPESTVSIPGYVDYNTPSTKFDIYNTDNALYTELPGPSVAKLVANSAAQVSSQTTQTEGLITKGCLVENANWCGVETPDYTDEKGCWASSEDCWTQSKTCYSSAPPTGESGCDLWSTKCTGIQDQCNAGNFNGPPNKGKVLTPKKVSIDVGALLATVNGGSSSSPKTSAKASSSKATSSKAATKTKAVVKTSAYAAVKEVAQAVKTTATSAAATPAATAEDADLPEYTITVAPSSANAPAPTEAPATCPEGHRCVVVTNVEVVTEYVTQYSYKKRSSFHGRRHGRHA